MTWTILIALLGASLALLAALIWIECSAPEAEDEDERAERQAAEARARALTELAHWQSTRGPQRLPGAPARNGRRW